MYPPAHTALITANRTRPRGHLVRGRSIGGQQVGAPTAEVDNPAR
jgi:hypothetical protein